MKTIKPDIPLLQNKRDLIAPCGMNCSICSGYMREKNKCSGCRSVDGYKPNYCQQCIIFNCDTINTNKSGFCYECEKYPCRRLRQLDKRYTTRYNMSMLENLKNIKDIGLDNFVRSEEERWKCDNCGGTICVHIGECLECKKN